ncbi:MAG TPA: SIS domain-containing protein [Actinomycetes bacterium]|nr:SIS domain-containing protein [Actinomycetes bacterium]
MPGAPLMDDSVLDDREALELLDAGEMLRAVATAGAQVREALLHVDEELVARVAADGRPRAVVITGMGGSGIAADVASAVAGRSCPVPVLASRGHRLPGWVGGMDVVVAVSCSGETEETLSALDEAIRRGARVVTVGAPGSSLSARADDGRAVHLPVDARGRMPRANLWGLATPVLLVLDALGLAAVSRQQLADLADQLDETSERCGPGAESSQNPAKQVAVQVAGSLPFVWGASDVAAVAASRFGAQLAENAKYPAVTGALPEVHHNQVVVLAGRFGALAESQEDIFRDPFEDPAVAPELPRMRLLLLRDTEEVEQVGRRADATVGLAERFDVAVDVLRAEGEHPVTRLASLVAPLDFASVYLALLQGIDPSPIEPILALKSGALDAGSPASDREDRA